MCQPLFRKTGFKINGPFMNIDDYILERLRADAAHTIAVANCEEAIQHAGVRGRLREILIANLLAPWLPPFCKCVTGMIIEAENKPRKSTQDDILVIDPSIAPPILANPDGPDGIFLLNSVLLRIEVKSQISKQGLREFVNASSEIIKMQFRKQPGCETKFTHPYSILVAFKSDSQSDEWDYEYDRFREVLKEVGYPPALSGFVSAICVVDKGFWFLGGDKLNRSWRRFVSFKQDGEVGRNDDRLACLVAQASDVAYLAHAERQGRDPSQGLEAGIGQFISPRITFPLLETN